jgi:hypothetical protein
MRYRCREWRFLTSLHISPWMVTTLSMGTFLCSSMVVHTCLLSFFGHSRKMMNHDHVHPPNSAFSHSPLRSTHLKEEHSTFLHTSYPVCPLV